MTADLIMKLIDGLLKWLGTSPLLSPVVPWLKSVIDNVLPGLISTVVPANLTAAQVLDALFVLINAEVTRLPNGLLILPLIKLIERAIGNELPWLVDQILSLKGESAEKLNPKCESVGPIVAQVLELKL